MIITRSAEAARVDPTACGWLVNLRVGEIAAVSMLLGHSWHQKKAGIMVNLFHAIIQYLIDRNVKYLIYHHAYGGTLGLQEFKRSLSFFPNTLEII